jgi:hypothetical protein
VPSHSWRLLWVLAIVGAVLFLTGLGATRAIGLTQPFTRALLVMAFVSPIAALIGLVLRVRPAPAPRP